MSTLEGRAGCWHVVMEVRDADQEASQHKGVSFKRLRLRIPVLDIRRIREAARRKHPNWVS